MTAKLDRKNSGTAGKLFRSGALRTGLAAALLLSTSAAALHAQDRDLQKELDQLKAQINSLKSAINEQRVETRKNKEKIKVVADRSIGPPVAPPGYTAGGFQPIGGFDDKKLHFGGITITPGGFIAAEGFFRSRATGADIGTGFAAIPFPNASLAHTNESKFSIRQSRLAMLVEANPNPTTLVSAYYEGDFNSTGTGSNFTQTDSFVPRVRAAYATVDFLDSGFHVLGGQGYSLMYTNTKGITPRNETSPPTIDSGIMPGYLYARQPGIRITKDFDKKLWIAVSAEQSATTFGSACSNIVGNTPGAAAAANTVTTANALANVTCLTPGGSGFAQTGETQQLSLNHIPDIFGKIAYEARFLDRDVHIEGTGVYRNFYDRVDNGTLLAAGYTGGGTNQTTSGYGVGGSIVAAVIPKVLDFQAQGMIGRGLGRYTSSGLSDATLAPNGSITPLRNTSFSGGFTFHATAAIDAYVFGGFDKVYANYGTTIGGTVVGYGIPTAVNTGCYNEGGTGAFACAGNTGQVWQLTGGLWDKFYSGPLGYLRGGIQYSYTKRTLLAGVGGAPSVDDHIIMTSLRYYPF